MTKERSKRDVKREREMIKTGREINETRRREGGHGIRYFSVWEGRTLS